MAVDRNDSRTRLRLRVVAVMAAVAAALVIPVSPAHAAVELFVQPSFPSSVTVGDTAVPALIAIANTSTASEADDPIALNQISLVPSCSTMSPDCIGGIADPGTFSLSPTGTGRAGSGCAGRTFTITTTDPATGRVVFTPDAPVTLAPATPGGASSACVIDFTFNVNKVPNHDAQPATSGVQTFQVASVSGSSTANPSLTGSASGSDVTTVAQAASSMATQATPTATVGQPISDTATVTGPASGPAPTGTVTFTAFGPNDATCTGTPAFTSTNRPLSGGPPSATATSEPFTPSQPGTYNWVAAYSGDANYTPVATACGDPAEVSQVSAAFTITTQATPTASLGQPITDTATVTGVQGGPAPTGTVIFTAYGPDNPACAGAPVFTSSPAPVGGTPSTATSAPFTPTAPGTYRWVAAYSGDTNYAPATTACNDPNETSVVSGPSITVTKTADPASRPEPGGDFTFTVVVTNTGPQPVTLTTLDDNVYGNLNGRGTCATGTTIAAGASYSCSFQAPFTGTGGNSQTDRVTAVVTDEFGNTATAFDDATVTITDIPPRLLLSKTPLPPAMPEPGGQYITQVEITNIGGEPALITDYTDSVFGDITDLIGNCEVGVVVEPDETYACFFVASFTGPAGATQTDTLTVTAENEDGTSSTVSDTATVTITEPAPTIDVQLSAAPASRPAPGGLFAFTVTVANIGRTPVTLAALLDDRDGYLGGRGNCPISAAVAVGATFSCTYTDEFEGEPGEFQIRTVRAIATDPNGNSAIDNDDAILTITGPPVGGAGAGTSAAATPVVVVGPTTVSAGNTSVTTGGVVVFSAPQPSGASPVVRTLGASPAAIVSGGSAASLAAATGGSSGSGRSGATVAAQRAGSRGSLAATGTATFEVVWPAAAMVALGAMLAGAGHRRVRVASRRR